MIDYNALKDFFHALNICSSIESIEALISNFSKKEVSLRIFDETIDDKYVNAQYINDLNTNLKNFEQFIEGKPITIKKVTLYPILLKGQLVGCLECRLTAENELENMSIVAELITMKIDNIRLSNTINKSLEFHNAMKNIAKIIETQYELNYILPIIGEILDTFVDRHLIYIYLKQNGKMRLMWPSNCLDGKIIQKISKLSSGKDVIYSKNRKTVFFPLISENNTIGYIVTKSTEQKELTSQEAYYIQQLATQAATTITRAKVYAEILKHATLDALTGFYNRNQLEERVKQEIAHAKRKGTPLCTMMADIDYFKHVNDTYGHITGDLVLKTISKVMRTHLREYDIVARYGGEEFVILLPNTKKSEAKMVAERLRKAIANKVIDIEKVNTKNNIKNINVTISIGICEYSLADKPENLVMNADKALYEAKDLGRNRIVFYTENQKSKNFK